MVAFFSFFESGFRTTNNFLNIIRAASFIGIMAVGHDLRDPDRRDRPLGRFDAGVRRHRLRLRGQGTRSAPAGKDEGGVHVLYAVLAAIGVGLAIGVIHGVLIANSTSRPSSSRSADSASGAAPPWSGPTVSRSAPSPRTSPTGERDTSAGPMPVIVFLGSSVAHRAQVHDVRPLDLRARRQPEAARLSGLNTRLTIERLRHQRVLRRGLRVPPHLPAQSAEQVAGQSYELQAIASVVIGGTSLFGGRAGCSAH